VTVDGRDNGAAYCANAAPNNKGNGADRLFDPGRIGIVRAEIAERPEWAA
jgi:hypothetical protein